ncbi:glycosyltransferase [Geodermatophilus sabuli]|uniref:Glycosyl transferase 4-like domain-containing protein n=1 Tax=Geodermatophilus sabuli TaxID=1564158 RepID=A0A285EK67_9ACTN|nr:glycosyltransferase family 4 protein [Geodermatophilus sabuli]MBB3087073.1 glycosyltransferase involved in cell wall biosynthesis [Geodermatophilus sabuli]SNX99410.1 Glycosyl transferase 4-like domain-containing protein [Geodermatophilus sabuli]
MTEDRHRALRVLFVTTRDIGQRATGRIVVLRTHAEALAALGHEVTVAVVSPRPPQDSRWTRRFRTEHVRSPRLPSVALSALRALTFGEKSLNESLFVDGTVRRRVTELVEDVAADVVVLDSLRLSTAVVDVRAPVVVDLDDLLSVRYERLRTTARSDPGAVLGFAAARVPGPLRGLAARGAVRLLGWEARRIAAREVEVSASAAAVSLVSRTEADLLARRTGRHVEWLPPAVPVPAEPVEPRDGLVFLGGLDYLPNLQALRFYRDEVLPHLDPGDPLHVLHVVGHCPDDVRAELDVPGIVLHGYVDDLHEALGRRLLVAPLVAGGGVKLKVLDGMAHGLPVAGTPGAFEGLGLPDGVALRAEDGVQLAALVRELAADPARCHEVGLRARSVVREEFSAAAAARRWAALLDRLSSPAASRS